MAEQVQDNQKFTGVRLPATVRPVHYDLSLKPDLVKFTFQGSVNIHYDVQVKSDEIVLHANELVISEGSAQVGGKTQALSKVTYSKDTETATLKFDEPLSESGVITLKFTGTLNDKMKGFYRTEFKLNGSTAYAATTQFEATDARRCFPCWDEPAIKATFGVTMIYQPETCVGSTKYQQVALSNMPGHVLDVCSADGATHIVFDKTPIMSTYLLAFVVGPFEMIEGTDGKRPIRVYTVPGKKEQGRFALEVACKSLPYYEEYFDIAYPLPKMDLIAIPDFAAGAMENWGLVTYREICLLVDPSNTSTKRKQYIAIVVAHELAHQWFGNLVTMEWWTHLWLNEGFASFMEYLCVDHIFPEYDIWSQFVADAYMVALNLDSLHNSHPIEVPVNHPSEIDEIFDDISYNKGASVIRMLHNYIGDASFRKGMKEYLSKFAYKNAATEDLWNCLEKASNKPVFKLMSGWTSQKGFPWLSVAPTRSDGKLKLSLTQGKFTADGKVPTEDSDVKWFIPITAITGSDPKKIVDIGQLEEKSGDFIIEDPADAWVKLNPGTVGLYHTAYPKEMVERILPAIFDQTLAPLDRLGIQNDFFALCQAGKVPTVDLLKLVGSFNGETNFTVWSSLDACMGRLNILFSNTDFQDKFHKFGRELYADIFKKLTWSSSSDESHTDAMMRALVINRLVTFNDEAIIDEAKRKFKAHLDGTESIPSDIRGAVYRAVSIYGDEKAFEDLFTIYRNAELHEEKNRAGCALGSAKGEARLRKVIDFVLSDEVKNQDKVFVIMPIGASSPQVAWKLLQDNKDLLREKYESGFLMSRLIKSSTENFASEEKAQEVAKFFELNKFPGAERTIQQSLETIRLNANWLDRDSAAVKAFLS